MMPKFLTLEKDSFGLDVSDKSLKIIKLKKRGRSFNLASFNQMEIQTGIIEKGVIQNEDSLAKIIQAACKNIKGEKLNTKYVIVSLPEEKSFLQVIKMPKMEENELKSAIIFEAENYIPLPIDEVYLDFQIIHPIKDNTNHLDVLIVAMPKKIINSYVSCLRKAGLIPLVFEIESQAIARALVKNEISSFPIVLIDFGETTTDFIVFSGHSIYFTYSIPISSGQLTVAISKSLEISLEKAEKIKKKYDLNNVKTDLAKKILQAINPILEDLIEEIKKYLNFYQDHISYEYVSSGEKINKILLCGGGANLKGLSKLLFKELEIPVEIGDFWINFPSKQNKNNIQNDLLPFVTALGLALRGLNKKKDRG